MSTIDAVKKFTECYIKRNKTGSLKHFYTDSRTFYKMQTKLLRYIFSKILTIN